MMVSQIRKDSEDAVIAWMFLHPVSIPMVTNEINYRHFLFPKRLIFETICQVHHRLYWDKKKEFLDAVMLQFYRNGYDAHIGFTAYTTRIIETVGRVAKDYQAFLKCLDNLKDLRTKEILRLKALPYREYLKSRHWRDTRLRALDKANFRCQVCNTDEKLEVHHRTYEDLGNEQLEDLTVLCQFCHTSFHQVANKVKQPVTP